MKKLGFMKKLSFAAAANSLLTGCSLPPSINVLGAYFPAWLFCIVAGVSLTVIVHVFSSEKSLGRRLMPVALTYPVLTTLFSLVAWLVFFDN